MILPGLVAISQSKNEMDGSYPYTFPFFKALFSSEAKAQKNKITESVKKIREIGRERIEKRIDDMNQGKKVPEDVLTYIIKASQEVSGDDREKMNVMMDEFILFFVAGKFLHIATIFSYPKAHH